MVGCREQLEEVSGQLQVLEEEMEKERVRGRSLEEEVNHLKEKSREEATLHKQVSR